MSLNNLWLIATKESDGTVAKIRAEIVSLNNSNIWPKRKLTSSRIEELHSVKKFSLLKGSKINLDWTLIFPIFFLYLQAI